MNRARKQATIRLTIRPPDGLDKIIREEAEKEGVSINQLMIGIIIQWLKSHQIHFHNL